jgi:hypothetical protein
MVEVSFTCVRIFILRSLYCSSLVLQNFLFLSPFLLSHVYLRVYITMVEGGNELRVFCRLRFARVSGCVIHAATCMKSHTGRYRSGRMSRSKVFQIVAPDTPPFVTTTMETQTGRNLSGRTSRSKVFQIVALNVSVTTCMETQTGRYLSGRTSRSKVFQIVALDVPPFVTTCIKFQTGHYHYGRTSRSRVFQDCPVYYRTTRDNFYGNPNWALPLWAHVSFEGVPNRRAQRLRDNLYGNPNWAQPF